MTAVLCFVDLLLPMLDAHAHGKGFCFHGDSQIFQMAESIPGAVAHGKDHMVAGKGFFAVDLQTGDMTILLIQVGNLCVEADFAAQGDDPLADILHNSQKHIRTHMGFGIEEDIFSGTSLNKLLQNPSDPGIVDTGIELSIGKGAGTAFVPLLRDGIVHPRPVPARWGKDR